MNLGKSVMVKWYTDVTEQEISEFYHNFPIKLRME